MYKAVFGVNIIRTRDIVLLPNEPLPEVSIRVWFFEYVMSKAAIRVQFLVIVQLQARSTPSGRVLLFLVFQLHAREVVILCDMLEGIEICAVCAI